jgi:hypothetical protein
MGNAMKETDTRAAFVNLLDQRLEEILECPAGWGGVDALEPLVLTLMMLRAKTADPMADERQVLRDYRRFLAPRVGPGSADLKTRLGAEATDVKMRDILREYVECMRRDGSGRAISRLPDPPPQRRIGGDEVIDIARPHYERAS